MDAQQFDDLLRSLSAAASRRGVVAGLTSSLLAALPLAFGGEEVEAKKKKGKRKKKKKKNKKKGAPCTPSCAGKLCGDDGCGGTCGVECTGNQICQDGTCVCASAGVCCDAAHGGGACAAGEACCPNALSNPTNAGCCPTGFPCCNTAMDCPAPFNFCPNGCCDQF